MTVVLTVDDLAPFADIDEAKAEAMIADAMAMAELIAPCITEDDFPYDDAAKAVIRGAVLRWNESGQGGVTQYTALGFGQSFDTRTQRYGMFTKSEIEALQAMCQDPVGGDAKAYSFDTYLAGTQIVHDEACSLNFGATYCSCGADIAFVPIYGVPP